MEVAGALLEFTPLLLNKCPPTGCATVRQRRTLQGGGQDPVIADDLLESGGVGSQKGPIQ